MATAQDLTGYASPFHIDLLNGLAQELDRDIFLITDSGRQARPAERYITEAMRREHPDPILVRTWSTFHPLPNSDDPGVRARNARMAMDERDWPALFRDYDAERVAEGGPFASRHGHMIEKPGLFISAIPVELNDRISIEVRPNEIAIPFYEVQLRPIDRVDWDRIWREPIRMAASENIAAQLAELQENASRIAFERLVGGRTNQDLNRARERINELETRHTELVEMLAQVYGELRTQGQRVQAFQSLQGTDADQYVQMWERLVNHPKVTELGIDGDMLNIKTTPLPLTNPVNPEEVKMLGPYQLSISLTSHRVQMKNLMNPRGGRDHPHVRDGIPCWGDLGSGVARLLAEGEYESALEIIIQYLESCNPADAWGGYIGWFFGDGADVPEVETATAEGQPVPQ